MKSIVDAMSGFIQHKLDCLLNRLMPPLTQEELKTLTANGDVILTDPFVAGAPESLAFSEQELLDLERNNSRSAPVSGKRTD